MSNARLCRYACGIGAAGALLAGCAGSQPPRVVPQALGIEVHADRGTSWMLPEAKSEDLLYVANIRFGSSDMGTVTVYTYPQGKLVGDLKAFTRPNGLCVDNAGNVFVANFGGEDIIEYPHGGTKPIATLDDNGAPYGCAIDPTTGNLAVTNGCDGPIGSCFPDGTTLIYKHAKGDPETLNDQHIPLAMAYCAYDENGDLFVDSYGRPYQIGFAELPRGSKSFTTLFLKLPKQAEAAGGLQWVGNYLVVGFADGNIVGQYRIKGGSGERVHAISLKGVEEGSGTNQFWVDGSTLVAPLVRTGKYPSGRVQFFGYPQGGAPTKTLTGSVDVPFATAISPAKA